MFLSLVFFYSHFDNINRKVIIANIYITLFHEAYSCGRQTSFFVGLFMVEL